MRSAAWRVWVALMVLVSILAAGLTAARADAFATPAAAVAAFYRGFIVGDRGLTESALLHSKSMSDTSFRAPTIAGFHILEVALPRKDNLFAKGGDVEVLVDVYDRTREALEKMSFLLRREEGQWRIVGYAPVNSDE